MFHIRSCLRAFAVTLTLTATVASTVSSVNAATVTQANVNEDQARLDQARADLANIQGRLEHAQSDLDASNRQLDQDAADEARIKHDLSGIARYEYTQPPFVMQMIRAHSVNDALALMNETRIVGERRQRLLQNEQALQARDKTARDSRAADVQLLRNEQTRTDAIVASAQAMLAQAQQDMARQQADAQQAQAMARQQAAAAVAAQAAAVSEASNISVTPAATAPAATATLASASVGNHFAFGYCTWYVASRRPIPWFGNAIDWWANARAYGFSEGQTPRVGAVMVSAEPPIGHVSYVEAVNPDGSWVVSEMNYSGWNVVDRRTVRRGQSPVVGFIY